MNSFDWQPLLTGAGLYLNVKGIGRMTIRCDAGVTLRINGQYVKAFPTLDEAKAAAEDRARTVQWTQARMASLGPE